MRRASGPADTIRRAWFAFLCMETVLVEHWVFVTVSKLRALRGRQLKGLVCVSRLAGLCEALGLPSLYGRSRSESYPIIETTSIVHHAV